MQNEKHLWAKNWSRLFVNYYGVASVAILYRTHTIPVIPRFGVSIYPSALISNPS